MSSPIQRIFLALVLPKLLRSRVGIVLTLHELRKRTEDVNGRLARREGRRGVSVPPGPVLKRSRVEQNNLVSTNLVMMPAFCESSRGHAYMGCGFELEKEARGLNRESN